MSMREKRDCSESNSNSHCRWISILPVYEGYTIEPAEIWARVRVRKDSDTGNCETKLVGSDAPQFQTLKNIEVLSIYERENGRTNQIRYRKSK